MKTTKNLLDGHSDDIVVWENGDYKKIEELKAADLENPHYIILRFGSDEWHDFVDNI